MGYDLYIHSNRLPDEECYLRIDLPTMGRVHDQRLASQTTQLARAVAPPGDGLIQAGQPASVNFRELGRGEVLAARADRRPVAGHAGRRDRARQRASRPRDRRAHTRPDRRPEAMRLASTLAGILADTALSIALQQRAQTMQTEAPILHIAAPVLCTCKRCPRLEAALRNTLYRAFAGRRAPPCLPCLPWSCAPTSPPGRQCAGWWHVVRRRDRGAPVAPRAGPQATSTTWRAGWKGEANGRLARRSSPFSLPPTFATPAVARQTPALASGAYHLEGPYKAPPGAPVCPGTP